MKKRASTLILPVALGLTALTGVAMSISGCGANGQPSGIPSTARGRIVLNIAWPEKITRKIPENTTSIKVELKRGNVTVAERTVTRNPSKPSSEQAVLDNILVGSYTLIVNALASDGITILAKGEASIEVGVGDNSPTITLYEITAGLSLADFVSQVPKGNNIENSWDDTSSPAGFKTFVLELKAPDTSGANISEIANGATLELDGNIVATTLSNASVSVVDEKNVGGRRKITITSFAEGVSLLRFRYFNEANGQLNEFILTFTVKPSIKVTVPTFNNPIEQGAEVAFTADFKGTTNPGGTASVSHPEGPQNPAFSLSPTSFSTSPTNVKFTAPYQNDSRVGASGSARGVYVLGFKSLSGIQARISQGGTDFGTSFAISVQDVAVTPLTAIGSDFIAAGSKLPAGKTITLSGAAVTGAVDKTAYWSVSPSVDAPFGLKRASDNSSIDPTTDRINPDTTAVLFQAPLKAGSYTITTKSWADPTKTQSITINVPSGTLPVIVQ